VELRQGNLLGHPSARAAENPSENTGHDVRILFFITSSVRLFSSPPSTLCCFLSATIMDPSSHELQRLQSGSAVSSQRLTVHDRETHTSVHDKGAGYGLQPEPSFYSRLVESSWTLEVLAWILAAAALVILIAVLAVFNGKSLSHWHSGVSINTLVNVLTTIASVALIFPVASGIAQMRWLWLAKGQSPVADIESFGSGPIDIFVMLWKHPTM